MSLSHYFELTPERYMRTYYGFPTFYTCMDKPYCNLQDNPPRQNMNKPPRCCPNHIQVMENFSENNCFLNR